MTDTPPLSDAQATCSRILKELGTGRNQRADDLLPLLYDELRALARKALAGEATGHTLQPTALVHEAWLRLAGDQEHGWEGRRHFLGAAAQAMRRILVDHARNRDRLKRGGGRIRVGLSQVQVGKDLAEPDLLALEDAVQELESRDRRKGRIVELRLFAGLTAEETARALDVSLSTVEREWRFIKAWLLTELGERLSNS